jgi:hypothetical protein
MRMVKVKYDGKDAVITADDDGSAGPVEIVMLDADGKPDYSQKYAFGMLPFRAAPPS